MTRGAGFLTCRTTASSMDHIDDCSLVGRLATYPKTFSAGSLSQGGAIRNTAKDLRCSWPRSATTEILRSPRLPQDDTIADRQSAQERDAHVRMPHPKGPSFHGRRRMLLQSFYPVVGGDTPHEAPRDPPSFWYALTLGMCHNARIVGGYPPKPPGKM